VTERDLFEAALDLPPENRAAYLDGVCGGDAALRQRLEGLLSKHGRAGSFLEEPALSALATVDERPLSERPGTLIGPYKLLEQIGEGGFGVVFLAEQQAPLRRKVALKVLKPGMDTRQVIARFEAERQALALMDHPNIARVLDGGETAGGRPYFIMELVRGIPITEFCNENQLTIRERLGLFVSVCHAIQHAHQKGIIHRDLKPSNVLVTLQEGEPLAKVIDFGIAKALGQQLTDKTIFTGFAQLVGTPLYMSPEQAGLSGLDIDTRTDIYSLGVLLYELFTGTTPFDKERFKEAGYDEIRRIIREEEPPRPSTRISTLGQAATTISTQCKSDPKRLSQLFRGELDWIAMKALEKDRNRRYETPSAFAADVQHYLHDEPVLACPPSAWYRLRKFARRKKTALAMAACVLLALAGAAGVMGWAIRDRAARQVALEIEAQGALKEAKDYRDQDDLLRATAAARRAAALLGQAGGSAEIRERAQQLLTDLQFLADVEEARLQQAEVKDGHFDRDAAAVRLAAAFRNYGLPVLDREPEELAERLAGSEIARQLVSALDHWAWCMPNDADRDRLLAVARRADRDPLRQQIREATANDDGPALQRLAQDPKTLDEPATTLILLGRSLAKSDLPKAVDLLWSAQQRRPGDFWINQNLASSLREIRPARLDDAIRFNSVAVGLRPQSPGAHQNLGIALEDKGRLDEAVVEYREAIRLKKDYTQARFQLGSALEKQGKLAEAEAVDRETIQLKLDNANYHKRRGDALRDKGKLDDAISEYREAIRLEQDSPEVHTNLGLALHDKGRLDDAIAAFRQALGSKKDFSEAYKAHGNLGYSLGVKGQLDEAIAECRKAIQLKPDLAPAYNNLGTLLCRHKQDYAGAIPCFREAIRLQPDKAPYHLNLGNALLDQARLDEAVAEYREAIRLKPDYALAHHTLSDALRRQGRLDDAIAEYREAIRFKPDDAWAHHALGDALWRQDRLDNAIAEYREAIRFKPDFASAHLNLGDALWRRGKFADGEAELRKAIHLKKDYAEAHHALGNALWRQGRLDDAIAEYREAIRLKKDFPEAHNNLGLALSGKGRLDDAIAEHREAIRFKPDDASAHHALGDALWRQGKFADGEAELRKAIHLKPNDASYHNRLAWLLATCADAKFRHPQQAVALAKRAVQLAPTMGNLWNTLGTAQCRAGTWKEAITALEKSMELSRGGTSFDWFFLAMAHWQLGRKEKARQWYDRAVQWMDKNDPKNGELLRFRTEAEGLLGINRKDLKDTKKKD
jgi:tetratricopeptide (TPR) repeat protein